MSHTVFVRDNNDDHPGSWPADRATVRCTFRGQPAFVGCCAGAIDASPCLVQVQTNDPALVVRGLVTLTDDEQVMP